MVRNWLLSVSLTLIATPALACVCGYVPPERAVARAEAAFTGKVIRSGRSKWTVEVDRVWKGEIQSRVEVFDANAGSSCAIGKLKKRRSYLFLVNIHNEKEKVRYSHQVCNWLVELKSTRLVFEENGVMIVRGEEGRWAEDWILAGQGEGKPPLESDHR